MRLYIADNGKKVYLNSQAPTRMHLVRQLGGQWFVLDGATYHIRQVKAEPSTASTFTGAAIGGLIGLIAGPVGAITGATIGGIIGNNNEDLEKRKVENFNCSAWEI